MLLNGHLTDRALQERLPFWGVLVLESHHSPQFSMDWRMHAFFKVVYVLQGAGHFYLGEGSERFSAGDVIVVRAGTRNRIVDEPGVATSLYVGCISKSLLRFDPELGNQLETRIFRGDVPLANRVASGLRQMVHAQNSETPIRPVSMVANALRIVQLVAERSAKPHRSERGGSAERQAMKEYVESLPGKFFEVTTIDDAARQLGMSRRTFTKFFSEETGESWLNYVRQMAIAHAQQRLRETDLSIISIAFECGFNDLSTFYRQFRARGGVSPARYRELHSKK